MNSTNQSNAQYNMTELQLRPADVMDQRVLDAMGTLPREAFVSKAHRSLAYADMELPLGDGQLMMYPKHEGKLLQSLELNESDRVLEVGTGSGWLTACLANLAGHVRSIDNREAFTIAAGERLAARGIDNVSLETADLFEGSFADEPGGYDAIAVTGALEEIPDDLLEAMSIGGRMFVVLGNAPVMEALLITRLDEEQWQEESMFDLLLPKLDQLDAEDHFDF